MIVEALMRNRVRFYAPLSNLSNRRHPITPSHVSRGHIIRRGAVAGLGRSLLEAILQIQKNSV